jgi:DNA ligase-1
MGTQLPTLYKRNSDGSLQQWSVLVFDTVVGGEIRVEHGQVGGKLQENVEVVSRGKNLGRANETTPYQQAILEALSKWEAKKKRGYVESKDRALRGEDDVVVGAVPMLAHKFSEHPDKIRYPALASPKLDGIRVIAVITDGRAELFSRTRKPVTSLPHVVEWLEGAFKGKTLTLDGEAYSHELKRNFESISSIVAQKGKPHPRHKELQYWVFDVIGDAPYANRTTEARIVIDREIDVVRMVLQSTVKDEAELMECFNLYKEVGFEGAMVRNMNSPYEHKRSYNLLKVKDMLDETYEITGAEEGKGHLAGHVGSFICRTASGKVFNVKLQGEFSNLKTLYENPKLWKGKLIEVRYQNLTEDGIPRFPVGLRIKEKE